MASLLTFGDRACAGQHDVQCCSRVLYEDARATLMAVEFPISPDKCLDTTERLCALEAVKSKLVKRPDPAATQLVTVLEELSKIYGVIQDELTTYFALFFDDSDPQQLAQEWAALTRLDAGEIRARMSAAQGRCAKIWNMYVRYLAPWFEGALNADESQQFRELFQELSEADSYMVDSIEEIAAWLTEEARATADLVEHNNYADANAQIASARRQAQSMRKRIVDAMWRISGLENEFIEISGAI